MNDERLKALYARALAERAARGTECQVPLEAMLAVLERRGSEAERQETLRQVLAHPACREEFELLRAVVRAAEASSSRWRVPAWGWAAGIALLLGTVWFWRGRGPDVDVLRGDSVQVTPLAPLGGEAPASPRLVWRPVTGAFSYEVVVVDTAGLPRFTGSTTDTTVSLPDSVGLDPGAVYRWWVRARRSDGTELRSPTISFTVRR